MIDFSICSISVSFLLQVLVIQEIQANFAKIFSHFRLPLKLQQITHLIL